MGAADDAAGKQQQQSSSSPLSQQFSNAVLEESFIDAAQLQEKQQPLGLDMAAFLPPGQVVQASLDPEQVRQKVLKEHAVMLTILTQRLNHVRVLKHMWQRGKVKKAVDAMVKMNDLPVAVDFLNEAEEQLMPQLTLLMCQTLLQVLDKLLASRFEGYVSTALRYVRLFLRCFGTMIKTTLALPAKSMTSLSLDERRTKCQGCFTMFKQIHPSIVSIAKRTNKSVGSQARDTLVLLNDVLQVQ
jgi:hypothetical protein